jgi:hypothetical protein
MRLRTLSIMLISLTLCLGAEKPAKRPAVAGPAVEPAALAKVVGDAAKWNFIGRGLAGVEIKDGVDLLQVQTGPVTLASTEALKGEQEVVVRFRFPGTTDKATVLTLDSAVEDLAGKERGAYITITPRTDRVVSWAATDHSPNAKRGSKFGNYQLGIVATRALSWTEPFRMQMEADMAASETLGEHWFTLKAAIGKEQIEYTLDGVPLHTVAKPGMTTAGHLRLIGGTGVQISRVSVSPMVVSDSRKQFVPVSLDAIVNADKIDGQSIEAAADSAGVPFVIANRNGRGQNHVDVGVSWLRQGNLEGSFSGERDAFGGRWPGALEHDPARIQLRVPTARYRALHLLAVSDSDADSVPIVTAQFFRSGSGFPVNFVSPAVPKLGDKKVHHIVIPLDPGKLESFSDMDYMDLELTKQVQIYRGYPDPGFYSMHGAGLPSSVRIFAATLELPKTEVTLTANAYGHVWTAPLKPVYTVKLRNNTGPARPITLELSTKNWQGDKTTTQKQTVDLKDTAEATFNIEPPCHGYHDLTLSITDGDQSWTETRSFAWLHEDTRERGGWEFGKGPMFGYWHWSGSHGTPSGAKHLTVMAQAGAETVHSSLVGKIKDPEAEAIALKYKMKTYLFAHGDHYTTLKFAENLPKLGLAAAKEEFVKTLTERRGHDGPELSDPRFVSYFAEPGIGHYTHAMPPDYYGEPMPPFTPAEETRYKWFLNGFVEGAKIQKEAFPGSKAMLPWGDPLFATPFLRNSEDVRKLVDGVTVDIPAFERLPEQQMHQVSIHRMYVNRQEFKKAGIEKPLLPMYEGPCIPTGPGTLSQREAMDLHIRNSLLLFAYGVDLQSGGFGGFDCAGAWGEQHYGGGVMFRIPWEMPKPAFAALATHTRMLNRCNFDGYTDTGSTTVYALRFKHYSSGKLVHVLWTLRGSRAITIAANSAVNLTDIMDNTTALSPVDGKVSLTLDASPVYLTGLPADLQITLGDADHTDAKPAEIAVKLSNFGDGSWTVSNDRDEAYERSHFPYIVRFAEPMTAKPVEKALAIHLDKPAKERVFMPHYTTLVPKQPIPIAGKASALGVWVKGASDWGRIIYSARDAKGERWINVGKVGAWNCDDLHSWTSFNFDGWRYLRMELPSHAPFDNFREPGTTWWGPYNAGDKIIDLPLTLEKVFIERRTHVMYVNGPVPAKPDDIELGDLYAEYTSTADQGEDAIRLANIRRPAPPNMPESGNAIAELAKNDAAAPTITRIALPEQDSDGTQCYVHFDKTEGVTYDVYASRFADGRGALQMVKGMKEPGGRVRGFAPNTDFYLFLVAVNAEGKSSKPSQPFKIHLEDLFGMK